MFDESVNNWVSIGDLPPPVGKEVSTSCWLKYRTSNVERCNVGFRGCVAIPEEPVSLLTQRNRVGSAKYEHILLGLAGMIELGL